MAGGVEVVDIRKTEVGPQAEFSPISFLPKVLVTKSGQNADIILFEIVVGVEKFVIATRQFRACSLIEQQPAIVGPGQQGEAAIAFKRNFGHGRQHQPGLFVGYVAFGN